jgi:hypothetical protein
MICEHCRHVSWDMLPSAAELAAYYQTQYTKIHSQDSLQKFTLRPGFRLLG